MRNEQWQITYPPSGAHPGADLTFGTIDTGYLTLRRPAFEFTDARTDDTEPVGEGGRRFGRDYPGALTITFDIGVDTVDTGRSTADNLDAVAALRAVWAARAVGRRPGAVAELRQAYGGRERVFYGRPRGFAPVNQESGVAKDQLGYTPVLARFECVDDQFYDGDLQSLDVTIAPPNSGGLIAPLVAPLSTVQSSAAERVMEVGGQSPAVPVVTIYGPGTGLSVEFVGLFTVGISGNLAYDQWARIDPRLFARTVLSQAGGSLAGRVTGITRLSDMLIPPGIVEVVLRGVDATATARANITWRDTYTYL